MFNNMQLSKFVPIIILSLFLNACGGTENTPVSQAGSAVSHGGPVIDYVSLVDNLRGAGAIVKPISTVSQPFFIPEGQLIEVNDQNVQVFEFSRPAEADSISKTISADGSIVGNTQIDWVSTVHFYKAGKLIVIYVGNNSELISLLEDILGPQFAGG